jgi:predicted O-methyltransferase YrrM
VTWNDASGSTSVIVVVYVARITIGPAFSETAPDWRIDIDITITDVTAVPHAHWRIVEAASRGGERMDCVDPELFACARSAIGFMPDNEGLALHDAGVEGAVVGPMLEIGSYCGKSAIYLGAAAREADTVLFTVDHHRGSEENQVGWEHHDARLVDPRTGRMDTLPFFRRTIEDAGLEDHVVAVVGRSATVAAHWSAPLGLIFIDGGHAFDAALADYQAWSRHLATGGRLVFHDVFDDPAAGGQAPHEVWKQAVADGFQPVSTTGSLRVLRASSRER